MMKREIDLLTNRRQFLATSAALAMSSASFNMANAEEDDAKRYKICVFTKPFNSLSFDELADSMAELGVDGIEAPIRKGGHVEPESVADRLPALHEALKERGLEVSIMASDINDPDDPLTHRVLRTASALGIKRYRMKYFKYDLASNILDQLESWRPKLQQLAAINHEYGVQGLYQNHAGQNYFGASLWDLQRALEGVSPDDLAVAFDIRHATAEAGTSWPTTFQMIRHSVGSVYVKDFKWSDESSKPVNVPLGQGRVEQRFFELLRQHRAFDGPISLHEEYLDHRGPALVPKHLAAIKKDLVNLRSMLGAAPPHQAAGPNP